VADEPCPSDSVSGAFVVCRSSAGECDATDNCDGTTVNCPADAKQPNNTPCTTDSNVCTLDVCNGVLNTCTHPAGNSGAVCRGSAGVCDLVETCDGSNPSCPADAKASSSTPCRAAAGFCDLPENCDGTTDNCPANAFKPASAVCRSSVGVCDVAENCTGSSANCPGDGFASTSTVCRSAAGVCDLAESCTGSGPACPADTFKPATTVCRSAVDACDVAEQCTGSSAACPADAVQPDTDNDGFCDGIDDCPNTPDPSQLDSDNDGDGDATSARTRSRPSPIAARSSGKLLTPPRRRHRKIKGVVSPSRRRRRPGGRTACASSCRTQNNAIDVTIRAAHDTVTKSAGRSTRSRRRLPIQECGHGRAAHQRDQEAQVRLEERHRHHEVQRRR
jgi:hypothetical protein